MTVTAKAPLGATTNVRKWCVDINTGTYDAPVWTGIFGITNTQPSKDATLQDDSDMDGEGWKSQTATALASSLVLKLKRAVTKADVTAYDPGQEALRLASDGLGIDNSVDIRFYEDNGDTGPKVEAYRGSYAVAWSPDGGAMDDLDMVTATLTGQGKRIPITHPGSAGTATPTLTGVAPDTAAAAGGDLVILTGTGFTDATNVHVAATDVDDDDWEVISGNKIALITPAHAAGAVDVTVTNAGGTSATSADTKLTYS